MTGRELMWILIEARLRVRDPDRPEQLPRPVARVAGARGRIVNPDCLHELRSDGVDGIQRCPDPGRSSQSSGRESGSAPSPRGRATPSREVAPSPSRSLCAAGGRAPQMRSPTCPSPTRRRSRAPRRYRARSSPHGQRGRRRPQLAARRRAAPLQGQGTYLFQDVALQRLSSPASRDGRLETRDEVSETSPSERMLVCSRGRVARPRRIGGRGGSAPLPGRSRRRRSQTCQQGSRLAASHRRS